MYIINNSEKQIPLLLNIFTFISPYFYEKWILTEYNKRCYNKRNYVNITLSDHAAELSLGVFKMRKLKALLGALLVASVFSVTACSSASSSSSSADKREDQAMPKEKRDQILDIARSDEDSPLTGELTNKTIKWYATWDINPDNTGKKTPADLFLFQELYGGNIEYKKAIFDTRYDDLAALIDSGEGIDFFYAGDNDAIPRGALKGMFVPADDYIDFDSPLWEEMQDANDSIMWDGKHYAVVAQTTGDSVAVLYNRKTIQEAGLEDPADLYAAGKWDWNAFEKLLKEFVDWDNQRFGIDGWWFENGLINTIGKPAVGIEDGKLVSNLGDPAMERVQNWMFELYQNGYVAIGGPGYGWDAMPNYIGEGKLLFYPVGLYELYYTPDVWKDKYGEDVNFVPMPRDPKADEYYIPMKIEAYSFVSGGKNPEGVAKYLDCYRYCLINDEIHDITGTMFKDDYGWTDEMVNMREEMNKLAVDNPVIDVANGVSADCAEILNTNLRQTTRGVPWNETYDAIASEVQSALDKINKGETD